jgi:3-hydroxyisobutyrate dehydrogenase-like beta-hydroxyacid dehydrogenase
MKVGLVGLGNVRSLMARNPIKSGRTLAVFNQTRVWAEALWLVLGAAQKMGEADWVAIARISFPEAGL